MSEQDEELTPEESADIWRQLHSGMAELITMMVSSSLSHDEARRRIGVVRLELAVAEGALKVLDSLGLPQHGHEIDKLVACPRCERLWSVDSEGKPMCEYCSAGVRCPRCSRPYSVLEGDEQLRCACPEVPP